MCCQYMLPNDKGKNASTIVKIPPSAKTDHNGDARSSRMGLLRVLILLIIGKMVMNVEGKEISRSPKYRLERNNSALMLHGPGVEYEVGYDVSEKLGARKLGLVAAGPWYGDKANINEFRKVMKMEDSTHTMNVNESEQECTYPKSLVDQIDQVYHTLPPACIKKNFTKWETYYNLMSERMKTLTLFEYDTPESGAQPHFNGPKLNLMMGFTDVTIFDTYI